MTSIPRLALRALAVINLLEGFFGLLLTSWSAVGFHNHRAIFSPDVGMDWAFYGMTTEGALCAAFLVISGPFLWPPQTSWSVHLTGCVAFRVCFPYCTIIPLETLGELRYIGSFGLGDWRYGSRTTVNYSVSDNCRRIGLSRFQGHAFSATNISRQFLEYRACYLKITAFRFQPVLELWTGL
jgi:hypothetical protein